MRLLLEAKADPNARAPDGTVAFHSARTANVARLLLEFKALPDPPAFGLTLTKTALASARRVDVVRVLLVWRELFVG